MDAVANTKGTHIHVHRVHPEGIILGGGGGKLQEMGVALYTFLYNCPKFWGEASPPPPPPG